MRLAFTVLVWSVGALAVVSSSQVVASPERADALAHDALQLDPNTERGGRLYAEHCAQCHGADAVGRATFGSPALAGQRRAYTIKQLADFAELERKSSAMNRAVLQPAVAAPQAWADLAAYLNNLAPTAASKTGNGRQVELGKSIFLEQCVSCHEEDGRGDADGVVPSLRNQHYPYLLRQIRNIRSSHRTNIDPGMVHFLDGLDKKEASAVADYLSRMQGPVRDRSQLNDEGVVDD